jgi:peroxiredoxin
MKNLAILAAAVVLMSSFITAGYNVGDKAVDFKLQNIDGKMVSMADFKSAKGFIITFTCNHCPFAKAYEDRIIALNAKYAPLGYPVIAINPNDPKQVEEDSYVNMQKRAKEKSFTFPYLIDETQEVTRTFGAAHTPHIYIVQKSGTDYVVKYIGAIDDNSGDATAVKEKYAEKAVDALLAGKSVNPSSTKAVGCSIKWKS